MKYRIKIYDNKKDITESIKNWPLWLLIEYIDMLDLKIIIEKV